MGASSLAAVAWQFDLLPPAALTALDGLGCRIGRSSADIATVARLSERTCVRPALALLERQELATRSEAGWVLHRRADIG